MIKAIILGQLRHYVTIAGAALVTWLISQGAQPGDAKVLAAALPVALSCAASIYDKYNAAKTTTPILGGGNG